MLHIRSTHISWLCAGMLMAAVPGSLAAQTANPLPKKEFKGCCSIGGMQSLFSSTGGKRNAVWEPVFYIEREITKPWRAFAEYAG